MNIEGLNQPVVCLYCKTYSKIHSDYPVNAATFRSESEVPRCKLHAQYTCSSCDKTYHFNGIAWCHNCNKFTCIKCGNHSIVDHQFLVYDYYYSIGCVTCNEDQPTLVYSETVGLHPFQVGGLRPDGTLQVWLPMHETIEYQPELKEWGNAKLLKMTVEVEFEKVEERRGHSKKVWDKNAEFWKEMTRSGRGGINHKYIIIPKMMEFIDNDAKKIMDIGCGEGVFSRHLAEAGFEVTGTDISRLLDYAESTEEEQQLGIVYEKIGIHDLKEHYDQGSFDQVTCNMAIMDIDNLPLMLENIAHILKPNGQFVFSITHPITAWPVVSSVRLPRDSQQNEDKGWILNNYVEEQPVLIHGRNMPNPMLYYPRMISTYVTTLVEYGFMLTGMSEPVPDEKIIRENPRHMFHNFDRKPQFMIFQTKLMNI